MWEIIEWNDFYYESEVWLDLKLCILSTVVNCSVGKMEIGYTVSKKFDFKLSISISQYLMMIMLILYQSPKFDIVLSLIPIIEFFFVPLRGFTVTFQIWYCRYSDFQCIYFWWFSEVRMVSCWYMSCWYCVAFEAMFCISSIHILFVFLSRVSLFNVYYVPCHYDAVIIVL